MKAPAPIREPIIPPELTEMTLADLSSGEQIEAFRITATALTGIEARAVTLESGLLEGVELSASKLKKASFSDIIFQNCLLFGTNLDGSDMHRVRFERGMVSGLVLSDSLIKDVVFTGVKMDLVNFRLAKLARVEFVDCDLSEADFQSAELSSVVIRNCNLSGAEFGGGKMDRVDLRGSDISHIKGATGLKGAHIDMAQLVSISQVMAFELGLVVEE